MRENIYHFNNGTYGIVPGKTRVAASRLVSNEDWKTATALKQRSIEQGEQGTLGEPLINFYGSYARVQFDDVDFGIYTKWSDLDWIS